MCFWFSSFNLFVYYSISFTFPSRFVFCSLFFSSFCFLYCAITWLSSAILTSSSCFSFKNYLIVSSFYFISFFSFTVSLLSYLSSSSLPLRMFPPFYFYLSLSSPFSFNFSYRSLNFFKFLVSSMFLFFRSVTWSSKRGYLIFYLLSEVILFTSASIIS